MMQSKHWALALLMAGAGFTPAAQATSFASLSTEQFVDASTYIVRGTVEEVWTSLEDGYVWTHAKVTVAKTLKGVDDPKSLVISSMGGVHEGYITEVPGAAKFSVGEDALFFLDRIGLPGHEKIVPVSKFLGVHMVRRVPGERRYYAMTFHPVQGMAFDARFAPHPVEGDRTMLDDLIGTIQARLAVGWDGKPIPGISAERLAEINTPARRLR